MTDAITCVITYIDEEQTLPADYVVRLLPGLFEARCYDEEAPYVRVIGVFVNEKAAIRATQHAGEERWRTFTEGDF